MDITRWQGNPTASLTANPGNSTTAALSAPNNSLAAGMVLGKPYHNTVIVEFRAKVKIFCGNAGNGAPNFGLQMELLPTASQQGQW